MRQPYKWGAKQFLATMEVGERREIDTKLFNYRGMQAQANRLKQEYDSRWSFETTPTGRYVIRVK